MPLRAWRPPMLITWPTIAFVPLVNVALLLVGVVVLMPVLLTPSGIPLALPKAVTAEAIGGAGIVITVTDQQLVYLDGHLTTFEELGARLAPRLAQGQTVLISADRHVSMGQVSAIWDLCRQLGATQIAMATTPANP